MVPPRGPSSGMHAARVQRLRRLAQAAKMHVVHRVQSARNEGAKAHRWQSRLSIDLRAEPAASGRGRRPPLLVSLRERPRTRLLKRGFSPIVGSPARLRRVLPTALMTALMLEVAVVLGQHPDGATMALHAEIARWSAEIAPCPRAAW